MSCFHVTYLGSSLFDNVARICSSGYEPSAEDRRYLQKTVHGAKEIRITLENFECRLLGLDRIGEVGLRRCLHFITPPSSTNIYVCLFLVCVDSVRNLDASYRQFCDV